MYVILTQLIACVMRSRLGGGGTDGIVVQVKHDKEIVDAHKIIHNFLPRHETAFLIIYDLTYYMPYM